MTTPSADQTPPVRQPDQTQPYAAPANPGCAGCLKAQLGQCARQLAAQKLAAARPDEAGLQVKLPQLQH